MDVGVSERGPEDRALLGLAGRKALVTGGSRGVGRATALLLGRAGADVGIAFRSRKEKAGQVVSDLEDLGVRAWAEPGDLATEEGVRALFRRVEEEFGVLDILVGNHGIWPPEEVPLADMSLDQWRRTLEVNLDSLFLTCREAIPLLREGGRIVLVGSTAGQRGEAFHGDYAASKGAISSLAKGLCVELAPRNITVNVVAPGWVDTEMAAPALDAEGLPRAVEGIPLGRVAEPEDVAGPILCLCSSLARHITGEVLNVNGGAVLAG